jgi:hypothetical protein
MLHTHSHTYLRQIKTTARSIFSSRVNFMMRMYMLRHGNWRNALRTERMWTGSIYKFLPVCNINFQTHSHVQIHPRAPSRPCVSRCNFPWRNALEAARWTKHNHTNWYKTVERDRKPLCCYLPISKLRWITSHVVLPAGGQFRDNGWCAFGGHML